MPPNMARYRSGLAAVHIGPDRTQDVLRFKMHVPKHMVLRLEAVAEGDDGSGLEIHDVVYKALLLDLFALPLANPSGQEQHDAEGLPEDERVQAAKPNFPSTFSASSALSGFASSDLPRPAKQ